MVSVYRGWHQLESRGSGLPIVDFDVSPIGVPALSFASRIEVLGALEALAGRLPSEHAFLLARVKASCATLRVLLGQHIAFPQYLAETLQLPAVPTHSDLVESQRAIVRRLLQRNGLDLERQFAADVSKRFEVPYRSDELSAWLRTAAQNDARRAAQQVAPDVPAEFPCDFTAAAAYWKGWANAHLGEPTRVTFNTTPRTRYLTGDAFVLAHHEVAGHALQMECWRRRIANGELHPAYGLTVVHGSEQFQYEGIAQTITDLIYDDAELSDDILWAREYTRYRSYVYQRAHVEMNEGADVHAVFRYLQEWLPFEDKTAIEDELRSRCLDPILRVYQFVYAAGDAAFLAVLRSRGKEAFLAVVRRLYAGPETLDRVLAT